jgi:CRP/FNR family transcriptional regulator, nitrogen oxide reductase regulator
MPEQHRLSPSFAVPVSPLRYSEHSSVHGKTALISGFPLFSNLTAADCGEIVAGARPVEFSKRQSIYREGDPIRQIVLLVSGCAKVTQLGQNGSEVILRLIGPGEVVGKVGIPAGARHCSMAQAVSASTALVWDEPVFEAVSQRFPVLRRNTLHSLHQRLEELEERFREISTERVAARLSRELIRLLDQVGRRVNGIVEISLSREELAQLIGTTLFTVSRLLSDWDSRGIVRTRRESVSIRNFQALQELAECAE